MFLKEAESGASATRKPRNESRPETLRISALEAEDSGGPIYYGLGSTARRESRDLRDGRDSQINDDLADEVEAIRLAADFSSRKLLSEQKRERRESL